ncbi:MAG: enoyl-CoA hydratase/isomerase [Gammaproteobacteria bacterium]|nr:enoyl-CoA hydratase/isomerase [Gammaproteobacteria bacterium]
MIYETLKVHFERSSAEGDDDLCFLQLHRPESNNTINGKMIEECSQVLALCREKVKVVIFSGLPEVFCFGADFEAMANKSPQSGSGPEPLYDLWTEMATGPFITVAHVRGKANAGGIGFVAACDLVLADGRAEFSLSELLFGLMPAYVLPFLIRRIGFQRAHSMTLMTKPVMAEEAAGWALVDAYADDSEGLLRRYLLRLRRLNKTAVQRYKRYMSSLDDSLLGAKEKAMAANTEVFSDPENMEKISRYVSTGKFPWEG